MPRTSPPRRMPVAPNGLFKAFTPTQEEEEEEIEELLQELASNQGFETLIGVIDSLISTIEYQELMIWSLAKLLEEKGLITRDELLKKMEEVTRRKTILNELE